MRSIRNTLLGLAALIVLAQAAPAQAQVTTAGPCDGAWTIKSTPDALSIQKGAIYFEDDVLIEGMTAESYLLCKYGFTMSGFTLISSTPVMKFKATYSSDNFGSFTNDCTQLTATQMTGTLTWNRADGSVWIFTHVMDKK